MSIDVVERDQTETENQVMKLAEKEGRVDGNCKLPLVHHT
jgi:hypothetical protein